jgi:hypothetical protein
MFNDACGGLRCEAFAPTALVNQERELDFLLSIDCPRQQSTAPEKRSRRLFDRGPETKLRILRMTVKKPLQLVVRLLECWRLLGKVLADIGIPIMRG